MSTVWEKIETWFFVTIITVLVWVYAEGENINDHEVEIAVRAVADGAESLQIEPAGQEKVKLTVQSSQSRLTQLKTHARLPFDLAVTADPNNVTQTLDLKTELTRMAPFSELGINILSTDPAKVSYSVEAMGEATIDVRVITPEGIQLAPAMAVVPPRVTVRLPQRLKEQIGNQKVEARLDEEQLERLEVNVPQTLDVPLSLPSPIIGTRATIDPAVASVTFTIRKQTDSHVIERVPVALVVSPHLVQKWDITVAEDQLFVSDVKVSGASDAIQRIRQGQVNVIAELRLTADNLETRIDSAAAHIDLPAGVTLVSPTPRINLTIRPRSELP